MVFQLGTHGDGMAPRVARQGENRLVACFTSLDFASQAVESSDKMLFTLEARYLRLGRALSEIPN